MLDRLHQLDLWAQRWTRSRAARAVGALLVTLTVVVWIAAVVVLARDGGQIDTTLDQVLTGISILGFMGLGGLVFARVVEHQRSTAAGKDPWRSAAATFVVVGGVVALLETLRGQELRALIPAVVIGLMGAVGRYASVRSANRRSDPPIGE